MKDKDTGEERELLARYVVIADGSLSRFGRALGNQRDKRLPQGMAIRGYFESPLHAEPWIESALDVRDRNGDAMPGLRLDLPVRRRDHQRRHRAAVHVPRLARHQHLAPDARVGGHRARALGHRPRRHARRGHRRAAADGRVDQPEVGPTWIAIGDAAGSINPFNGEGIDYAYETGRMAAELIDEALETGSAMPLARYPDLLEAEYGLYFQVARAFAHVIGQPALMQQLTRVGMQSQSLMEWVLRIMANLLRPDELGPAEAAYRAVAAIAGIVPERIPA